MSRISYLVQSPVERHELTVPTDLVREGAEPLRVERENCLDPGDVDQRPRLAQLENVIILSQL